MIVGFNLLDEELVYSGGARFQRLMDYPNRELAVLELFGTRHALATADLPVHLGHLAASLPPGHPYTVDRLIDRHTLYPLYAAFLPERRANTVRAAMESDDPTTPHVYTGVFRNGVRVPTWFRYCPVCVDSDRDKYGEAFWHRVHQVPGVLVCPEHMVFLEESSTRARTPVRLHEFVPAEVAVQSVTPRTLDPSDPSHVQLARLAGDAAWLLRRRAIRPEAMSLHRLYVDLLAERGYMSPGVTRIPSIGLVIDGLLEFYTPSLLAQLQCPLDKSAAPRTWLHRLLGAPLKSKHPLMHLLMIQFLGHTVESVFSRPERLDPFGESPFPCLNRASPHYGEPFASLVGWHTKKGLGKVAGTFRCADCGFAYTRRGPDRDGSHRFALSSVRVYGPTWERKLQSLLDQFSGSAKPVARALGCAPKTVRNHADRLRLKSGATAGANLVREDEPDEATMVEQYRTRFLSVLANCPGATRTELYRRRQSVFNWLRAYDGVWLELVLPRRRAARRLSYDFDDYWRQRDAELSVAVVGAALAIRRTDGSPRRISVSSIARHLTEFRALHYHRDKLPHTRAELARLTETEEDFAVRRIKWAVDHYRTEGRTPTLSQLMVRAGLRGPTGLGLHPRVRAAAEAALASLPPRPIILKGRWANARG